MENKNQLSIKSIVAIGIGAALFFVLGRFVAIPSPVPNTTINIQYGILGVFGIIYGPVVGILSGFIGHTLIDLSWGSPWWSWIIASAVFGLIAGLAAIDFSRAFVVFHTIFFPGKSNWIFDWRTDAIILILPEAFFRNCAILIVSLLLIWCIILIISDLWIGKRLHPQCGKFKEEQ